MLPWGRWQCPLDLSHSPVVVGSPAGRQKLDSPASCSLRLCDAGQEDDLSELPFLVQMKMVVGVGTRGVVSGHRRHLISGHGEGVCDKQLKRIPLALSAQTRLLQALVLA